MTNIEKELKKLGVTYDGYSVLQNKDGITVARISDGEKSYILKHFEKKEHRREIKNYSILMSLNIPTADVLAANKSSLLLRDIAESDTFRLGTKEDMSDVNVARGIARWYKKLHQCGYKYVADCKEALFDEADYFTEENIDFIKRKTNTQNAAAWALLKQNFFAIDAVLSKAKRTLTYNDFYYTNMAVAKDGSAALMFDYNLLGKGYAYADIRNVLSSLSDEAQLAFLDEYGAFDPTQKILDDVVSPVITLYFACKRDVFPSWAKPLLEEINTSYIAKIEKLKSLF